MVGIYHKQVTTQKGQRGVYEEGGVDQSHKNTNNHRTMTSFTTDEKVSSLFKKMVGKPSTNTALQFFSEPSLNSRPSVFPNQVFRQTIPSTRPTTGWDIQTNLPGNMSPGDTSTHDSAVLKYYYKWELEKVTNGNDMAYKAKDENGQNPLAGSIPFNLDSAGGYGLRLFRRTNGAPGSRIYDGTGDWVVDPDAGVLTFYEYADVSAYVSENNPPYLSFYRYVGEKGLGSASPWSQVSDGIKYNVANATVLVGRDASESSGAYKLEVHGDARFTGQVFAEELTCLSDRRTKKGICAIAQPLQKLQNVRGVRFQWKRNNNVSYGVVADEVERALPQSTVMGPSGHASVNYNAVIGLLVEAIKAQNNTLERLGQQVTRLQSDVQNLKASQPQKKKIRKDREL